MRVLLIEQCSDPQLWYAGLIGRTVPMLQVINEGYLSREPAGYLNIVRREDGRIINDDKNYGC